MAIITFLFNIIISIAQTRRSYQLKHAESFYSLCLSVSALILSFITVLIFISFDNLISWIVILTAGVTFLLFGFFNVIQFLLERRKGQTPKKEMDFSGRESVHHELVRKIFHILLFVGIIALLTIAYFIIEFLYLHGYEISGIEETYLNYWGNLNGLGMWHIRFDVGKSILVMFFLLLTTIFTMNEGARLGKWFYFPLRKLAAYGIREKERETVASYVYFVIGISFAATFLYPIPAFSLIGIMCFGDTAASLFGRKYGRHKLQFNKIKSWEGAIGGVIVCYVVTLLFVGPIWALVATLVFFILDIITPVVPISDNIGIPICVTGAFLLL